MKTNIKLLLSAMVTISLASCNYSEDDITASGIETSYKVAEGNTDYDKTIKQFYDKTGKYLLYDFTDKDAYWTPTGWQNGELTTDSTAGKTGFLVTPAKKEYVSKQVALLDEVWFNKLSDNAMKKLLPTVILLCSEVNNCVVTYVWAPTFHMAYNPSPINAKYNYDNISVTYGSEAIDNITDDAKKTFQKDLFIEWAQYIAERQVTPSDEFSNSVNYSDKTVSGAYGPANSAAVGILNDGYNTSAAKDWMYFIDMMLLYPESYLTEDPGDISSWYGWTSYVNGGYVYNYDTNFHGILNATKDTSGILRTRYNLVRNYFIDSFGVDLQAIGNSL